MNDITYRNRRRPDSHGNREMPSRQEMLHDTFNALERLRVLYAKAGGNQSFEEIMGATNAFSLVRQPNEMLQKKIRLSIENLEVTKETHPELFEAMTDFFSCQQRAYWRDRGAREMHG